MEGIIVIVALLAAAVPLVMLGLLIAIRGRQEKDYQELTRRLNRIEWNAEQMRDLLRRRAETPPEKTMPAEPAPAKAAPIITPAKVEPIEAEVQPEAAPRRPWEKSPLAGLSAIASLSSSEIPSAGLDRHCRPAQQCGFGCHCWLVQQ